jgi:hypothetical protein
MYFDLFFQTDVQIQNERVTGSNGRVSSSLLEAPEGFRRDGLPVVCFRPTPKCSQSQLDAAALCAPVLCFMIPVRSMPLTELNPE